MEQVFPWRLLEPARIPGHKPKTIRRHETDTLDDQRLLCAHCHHPITRQEDRIHVNGHHEHSYTNPHGNHFHIGCFRDAKGCVPFGSPTQEHTWFPDYAWLLVHCSGCRAHLGWAYHCASDGFYGLILDKLTAAGEI
jgi:hypothetical protein